MPSFDAKGMSIHLDLEMFRQALALTSAETGFSQNLVEKDYFCSLLLAHLAESDTGLVFKGGTCLAKVHSGFYRMSEDLDFTIPTPPGLPRKGRGARAQGFKKAVHGLLQQVPGLAMAQEATGANASRQYIAVLTYASVISDRPETIKLEVSLREELAAASVRSKAKTILIHRKRPVTPILT